MYDTICMSGGGVKGLSFIGTIEKLIKIKYINISNIKKWVGTSVGAIIAYLFSLNYSIEEIKEFIINFDFSKLVPTIELENILLNHGIDNGEKIKLILTYFLKEKYNIEDVTFKKLYNMTNKKLVVIGTNFTKAIEEVFSYDTTPDMSVITAVRISLSIPIIFTPIFYNNNYYIDGGISNNFPINYCNINTTLGIYIKQTSHNELENILSIPVGCLSIISDVITTKDCNNYDIIVVQNDVPEMINFEISLETKNKIFNLGVVAVNTYIKNKQIKVEQKNINTVNASTQTDDIKLE